MESRSSNLSKSSLIQLLKTLSKEEIKQFDKFVRSPFFNNRSEVTRYFQVLKKYHPSFDHKDFVKEKIYRKLYPGKKYKDDIMRRLSSNLFRIAEDYFAVAYFNRHEFPYSSTLLDSLSKHGLDDLYMRTYAKIISDFDKQKVDNSTFLLRWIYESSYIDHNLYMSRQGDIVSNAVDSGIYHILNFFAQLPINYQDIKANKFKFNYEPGQNLIEKFISKFDFEGFLEEIDVSQNKYLKYLSLYVYQFLLFRFPENEEYYYKFKSEILKHKDKLLNREINLNLHHLQDYCSEKFWNGNHKYINEFHELSRFMIEENLMENYRFIPLTMFNSIVEMNLCANKLDFVEEFINKYGDSLTPDVKEDALSLCRAKVYFEKHQFEQALEEVIKVKYVIPQIQLWVKFLLSKIYFELNYSDLLISHIDTFKHYIRNNKIISEEIKKKYNRFLVYVLKLNKLRSRPDSRDLFELRQVLIDKDSNLNCGHKDWLLEKIEELERSQLRI